MLPVLNRDNLWCSAGQILIYRNKTVFADEIDSAINPVLSDRVLAFINGTDHKGQFIFTTHNALNLTFRTYMKEQMYFVTKDAETLASSMYSLADFSELRYDVKGKSTTSICAACLGVHKMSKGRRPAKQLSKKHIVYCEGKTESRYLEGLRTWIKEGHPEIIEHAGRSQYSA